LSGEKKQGLKVGTVRTVEVFCFLQTWTGSNVCTIIISLSLSLSLSLSHTHTHTQECPSTQLFFYVSSWNIHLQNGFLGQSLDGLMVGIGLTHYARE
jgi:hypothetical protein